MEKQQTLPIETIPPKAWRAEDLISTDDTTGNQFVDVLRDTLDVGLLKAHFKNDQVIKATAEDKDSRRKSGIQSLIDSFYVLVPEIVDLYDRLDLTIKSGYHNKVPKKNQGRVLSNNLLSAMGGKPHVWLDDTAVQKRRDITAIVGPKNCGKTAAIERCLSLYPQVVWHDASSQAQIVYLKVELKGVSNLLEYCARFLEALELALGSDKFDEEVKVAPNVCAAFMKMRSLLTTYNVGTLVIDSLETTRNWPIDKRELLFEHLSGLADITPVVLLSSDVNCYDINEISSEKLTWDPLCAFANENEELIDRWSRFTARLWKFNCLKAQDIELNEELKEVWFNASKGVVGIAVRFYARCLHEAINTGVECISKELMLRVQKKYFSQHRSFFSDIAREKRSDKSAKSLPQPASKPKRRKTPKLESMQRKDFSRIPRSQWNTLPEDDLRYLASQQEGSNYYLMLKTAGLVLPIGEFTLRDKFPQTLPR